MEDETAEYPESEILKNHSEENSKNEEDENPEYLETVNQPNIKE